MSCFEFPKVRNRNELRDQVESMPFGHDSHSAGLYDKFRFFSPLARTDPPCFLITGWLEKVFICPFRRFGAWERFWNNNWITWDLESTFRWTWVIDRETPGTHPPVTNVKTENFGGNVRNGLVLILFTLEFVLAWVIEKKEFHCFRTVDSKGEQIKGNTILENPGQFVFQ